MVLLVLELRGRCRRLTTILIESEPLAPVVLACFLAKPMPACLALVVLATIATPWRRSEQNIPVILQDTPYTLERGS
jgi:hypothetical protein